MFRKKLAEGFGGDLACPLATKWFIRIVAECAEEELREENSLNSVAPYWRILKPEGGLNEKSELNFSVTLDFLEEDVMPFVEVIPLERKDFKLMKISSRL